MNTLIKSIVGKFSTVALHATLPFTGYKYDDIDSSRSYRLRSLLSEIWDNRIDEGFHMAYEQFIQALNEKDYKFISTIANANLERALEKHNFQLLNLKNGTKDIIYSELTLSIGDKSQQCVKMSLFDCVNLNLYGNDHERSEIENVTLRIECYILSQLMLYPTPEPHLESIYHRVIFELKQTQAANSNPDLIKVLLFNSKKRIKYLRNHFIGKQYEWRIMEIDNLNL
ncbi:unnamed protein product [Paramecium pentaurelia]|uniref:Uncharacterized protein n=1 Tax=Paramecium pentaurelia TaxID=43138 RepID=A0A8S1VKQ7_9CILI|nr:unnamed protein product [Paramecium pentaurelia]